MSNSKHRPTPISVVREVSFTALTADQWRSLSVGEIKLPSNKGSETREGTPHDINLGALETGTMCGSCGLNNMECPGHFGHIELREPCYNPVYLPFVYHILKCVCQECGSPKIPTSLLGNISNLKGITRFKAYQKKAGSSDKCTLCKSSFPEFTLDKKTIKQNIKTKDGALKESIPVTAREACSVLMKISDETMEVLGFNSPESDHKIRPESFIFVVLPVIPTCARPWIVKGSEKKEDDITDKYNAILKINNKLGEKDKDSADKREAKRKKLIDELHNNIFDLIDNSKDKGNASGRQHKGMKDRLTGKDGHLQGNVAGKRSNFTARTVIVGGGSILKLGELGVPEQIAKRLTISEVVLEWNKENLTKLLETGKINVLIRNGQTIDVQEFTNKGKKPFVRDGVYGLQLGDIVCRQLQNGDWGIFNRQPTLRIESMQGVKIVILKNELAMRVPLAMTRPLNADFDGDECNLHIPQSSGAIVECSTISKVAYHVISAQNNAPVMGCVQNTLVLVYLLTETFSTPPQNDEEEESSFEFTDGSKGWLTMIDVSDFYDACQMANISPRRISDMMKRAKDLYPEYISLKKEKYTFSKDKIPGKLVISAVFPANFTFSRDTGTNDKLKFVDIKNGIIVPTSGPLCKKIIGGTSGSAIHFLWKLGPEICTSVISELQFIAAKLITVVGFSMGMSDCIPNGKIDVKKTINEALLRCDLINKSTKTDEEKDKEINSVLNEAMSVSTSLAKNGMNKDDRNSLRIMKNSGAKGTDTNNGQIAGFVGQQNIDGKRLRCTLSDGTRTLPHFKPGDNSPEAKGFVPQSYLNGLDPISQWHHASGGRRGVVDTAMKTADSGYIQKRLSNTIMNYKVRENGSVVNSSGQIIQFAYGGDGLNSKEMIGVKELDRPFFCNPASIASIVNSEAENDKKKGEPRNLTDKEIKTIINYIKFDDDREVAKRITYNTKITLQYLLEKIKVHPSMIPEFCKKIINEYEEAKAKNGYMVGLVAASSIGEPTTQLTLNSVDWHTKIFVKFESRDQPVFVGDIGKFIDDIIEKSANIIHYENETEYVDVKHLGATVTCVDEDGKMHWKRLEAVTRHLPGGNLVEIKTRSGRTVKVTKSKSLLVRENNKIVPKKGSEIKKGDRVPIVIKSPKVENEVKELDVSWYLPKNEYIYGSEMKKMEKYKSKVHSWWANGIGKEFIVPYSRGDSASNGLMKGYLQGCVYPMKNGHVVANFPDSIPLDELTGFLFGSYLADGCTTEMYVSISKNNMEYLQKIKEWCDRYSIGYHVTVQTDKNSEGWTSTDIRIHSTLLSLILKKSCNTGSANKHIPSWSLVAPLEFVSGLLDGYISGDGTINKKDKYIVCSSASRTLLEGIAELCSRFGIFGSLSVHHLKSNNIGSKVILPVHTFSIRNEFAKLFAKTIKLTIKEKQDVLDTVKTATYARSGGKFDIIPGVSIGKIKGDYHRDDVKSMIQNVNGGVKKELQKAFDSEVFFDEIMSVNEIESSTPKVYDLTVEDTRNFTIFGGLCVRDTFHNAGNSAKDVTLGVPRLNEMLNATQDPSKKSCTIYLVDPVLKKYQKKYTEFKAAGEEKKEKLEQINKNSLYRVTEIANKFPSKKVDDFIKDYELRYLNLEEDEIPQCSPTGLITYEEYEESWWVSVREEIGMEPPKFKPKAWVIILSLDIEKLYPYKITVEDIAIKIEETAMGVNGPSLCCVPSPNVVGQIEVYINYSTISNYVKEELLLPPGEVPRPLVTPENMEYYIAREVAIDLIKKTEIMGVNGITKTYVRQDFRTGEWMIDTQGSNYKTIMGMDDIDNTRTVSDQLWEVYDVLGIEAARKFYIKDVTKVLSFDGTYINQRHISLLADAATRTGTIVSIKENGIPRDVGPIAKGLFEKAVDNFSISAAFGEVDSTKGVAAAVMFGKLALAGTGTVEIKEADKLPVNK